MAVTERVFMLHADVFRSPLAHTVSPVFFISASSSAVTVTENGCLRLTVLPGSKCLLLQLDMENSHSGRRSNSSSQEAQSNPYYL